MYGLGAVALGLTGLVWGDFAVVWQPAAKGYAGPTPLGYAVAVLPLVAGLAMQWRRAMFYSAVVLLCRIARAILFFDVPRGIAHASDFGAWYGVLDNSALAAAAFIICMFYGRVTPAIAERLSRIARIIFGICLIYFGLAHHYYLANTVSYVPRGCRRTKPFGRMRRVRDMFWPASRSLSASGDVRPPCCSPRCSSYSPSWCISRGS